MVTHCAKEMVAHHLHDAPVAQMRKTGFKQQSRSDFLHLKKIKLLYNLHDYIFLLKHDHSCFHICLVISTHICMCMVITKHVVSYQHRIGIPTHVWFIPHIWMFGNNQTCVGIPYFCLVSLELQVDGHPLKVKSSPPSTGLLSLSTFPSTVTHHLKDGQLDLKFEFSTAKLVNLVIILAQLVPLSVALTAQLVLIYNKFRIDGES